MQRIIMQNTTQEERTDNARKFYQLLNRHKENRACVVVNRNSFGRTQFIVVPGRLSLDNSTFVTKPLVIADNEDSGITGCWKEFIESVMGEIPQKEYTERGFNKWLDETMGFSIAFCIGTAFVLDHDWEFSIQ